MEEILRALQGLWQTLRVIAGQGVDLVSTLVDFLQTSSVVLPPLIFIGITIVAFLLGLFLGRISRRGVSEPRRSAKEMEADRVVLDLERLTPLGLSAEEEEESEAMDLSQLRPEEMSEETARSERRHRPEAGAAQ